MRAYPNRYVQRTHGQIIAIALMYARVLQIMGNPPYSVGQKSGNDNNQNMSYPNLDNSVAKSYVQKSKAALTRNAYDTYIKAFRWATDRIGDNGVIGFVTNGAFLDAVALDGFRQCLLEEFNSVYCYNLRGNQRTSGELSRKEGGKIFGSGSRTPVCITILIKKKGIRKDGFVHYHDIGDYLSRTEKLEQIKCFKSIGNITWESIIPDENGDWLNKRNPNFINFIALGDKKGKEKSSVWSSNFAAGIVSSRDSWVYSYCHSQLAERMTGFIDFYNSELDRCYTLLGKKRTEISINPMDSKQESQFLLDSRCMLPDKINWSAGLTSLFLRNTPIEQTTEIRTVMMRPFCKEYLFFNRKVIERPSKWSAILPDEGHPNLIICVSGAPLKKDFSVLITDCIQDFHTLENSQSFPLYLYDEEHSMDGQLSIADLMENVKEQKTTYKRRYAISDASLAKFNSLYGNKVTKEDIFYYVYAVLHSKKYIEEYADNLSKELPRIPMLDRFAEWVRIGRELADFHLHYEKPADPAALGLTIQMTKEDYTVEKMRFAKEGKVAKKDTIQYNNWITISNIPERAYEYIINGQSAIEWIMEKYQVTTDKASGIKSNPNDYAGGKYIFDLLISIISMSLKTLDLIDALPEYKEI